MIALLPIMHFLNAYIGKIGPVELKHFYDFAVVLLFGGVILPHIITMQKNIFILFLYVVFSLIVLVFTGELYRGTLGFYHRNIILFTSCLFGYYYVKQRGPDGVRMLLNTGMVYGLLTIAFGLYQLLFGEMVFLGSKYRLAGTYIYRPVAYSLATFISFVSIYLKISYISMGKNKRRVHLLLLGMLVILLVLTYTRLTTLMLVAFIAFIWHASLFTKLVSGAISVFLIYIFREADLFSRYLILINQLQDLSSYRGGGSLLFRVEVITTIFPVIKEQWLLGHGPGSFNRIWDQYMGVNWMSPHFDLLSIWLEMGLVGLMLFLTFIFSSARRAWRIPNRQVAKSLVASILLIYIASTFNTPTFKTELLMVYNTTFWGFVAVYRKEVFGRRNTRIRSRVLKYGTSGANGIATSI